MIKTILRSIIECKEYIDHFYAKFCHTPAMEYLDEIAIPRIKHAMGSGPPVAEIERVKKTGQLYLF